MAIEIANDAIKTAESWITTAETMLRKKVFNTALYAEEMAVEIALKGVILSMGIEPPKVHNIIKIIEINVLNSGKFQKKYKDEMVEFTRSLLPELLRTRQISGYTFNFNINNKELENLAKKYLGKSKECLKLCKEIVEGR